MIHENKGREEIGRRFERLIRDHYEFVWRCARRLGVRPADLDDVVEKVFVVAAEHLDGITHEAGFLFRACADAASHCRRSVLDRHEVGDKEDLDDALAALPPEQAVESTATRRELQEILDQMPIELKIVLVLFELEQFTITEIARTLLMPEGTATSRLHEARELFVTLAADRERIERRGD